MEKNYKNYFLFLLCLFLSPSTIFASEEPTFKVRGLSASEWGAPKILLSGNSKITVSFMKYSFESGSNIWVDGSYYDNIDYIRLNDASNEANGTNIENNINFSSYILIEIPEGSDPVTQIELIGYAYGANNIYDTSNLVEAYSTTDDTNNAYKLFNPTNAGETWATGYSMLGPSDDVVGNGNSLTHVIGRYDATYTAVDPIPANDDSELESIRYIRINWSSAEFGNLSYMGRGRPLALFGFNIYTKSNDNPVNIEEKETKSFTCNYINGSLETNEISDVYVYSLSGSLVSKVTNIQKVDLSSYSKGLYVIKAVSKESGNISVRKVSLDY